MGSSRSKVRPPSDIMKEGMSQEDFVSIDAFIQEQQLSVMFIDEATVQPLSTKRTFLERKGKLLVAYHEQSLTGYLKLIAPRANFPALETWSAVIPNLRLLRRWKQKAKAPCSVLIVIDLGGVEASFQLNFASSSDVIFFARAIEKAVTFCKRIPTNKTTSGHNLMILKNVRQGQGSLFKAANRNVHEHGLDTVAAIRRTTICKSASGASLTFAPSPVVPHTLTFALNPVRKAPAIPWKTGESSGINCNQTPNNSPKKAPIPPIRCESLHQHFKQVDISKDTTKSSNEAADGGMTASQFSAALAVFSKMANQKLESSVSSGDQILTASHLPISGCCKEGKHAHQTNCPLLQGGECIGDCHQKSQTNPSKTAHGMQRMESKKRRGSTNSVTNNSRSNSKSRSSLSVGRSPILSSRSDVLSRSPRHRKCVRHDIEEEDWTNVPLIDVHSLSLNSPQSPHRCQKSASSRSCARKSTEKALAREPSLDSDAEMLLIKVMENAPKSSPPSPGHKVFSHATDCSCTDPKRDKQLFKPFTAALNDDNKERNVKKNYGSNKTVTKDDLMVEIERDAETAMDKEEIQHF